MPHQVGGSHISEDEQNLVVPIHFPEDQGPPVQLHHDPNCHLHQRDLEGISEHKQPARHLPTEVPSPNLEDLLHRSHHQ